MMTNPRAPSRPVATAISRDRSASPHFSAIAYMQHQIIRSNRASVILRPAAPDHRHRPQSPGCDTNHQINRAFVILRPAAPTIVIARNRLVATPIIRFNQDFVILRPAAPNYRPRRRRQAEGSITAATTQSADRSRGPVRGGGRLRAGKYRSFGLRTQAHSSDAARPASG
jgi:hypothetical protein